LKEHEKVTVKREKVVLRSVRVKPERRLDKQRLAPAGSACHRYADAIDQLFFRNYNSVYCRKHIGIL
jgi:hypothetical protein